MKQLCIGALALLAVIFHAQSCSAEWFDNVAVANEFHTRAANGRTNAGRCLDFASETANGQWARAGLWTCHANTDGFADHQRFGVWVGENWTYQDDYGVRWFDATISHVHNGVRYCLDVDHGNAYNGAPLQFWKCNDGAAQLFSFSQSAKEFQFKANPKYCIAISNDDQNGAQVVLKECIPSGRNDWDAKFHFFLSPLGYAISNALPELGRRCQRPGAHCRFKCPGLWRNGPYCDYWIDGTRLACNLNDEGYLSCNTAWLWEGPSSLDGRCECECDYPDPGHKELMPQTQRFPVPQQRTSPDMPLELRNAFNATARRVV